MEQYQPKYLDNINDCHVSFRQHKYMIPKQQNTHHNCHREVIFGEISNKPYCTNKTFATMKKLDYQIYHQFHQNIRYVMITDVSTESYYNSEDDYSIITLNYFDQFNENFIGMNCYTYTLLHIIHAFGMDNEIVQRNSYTIIASMRRYLPQD